MRNLRFAWLVLVTYLAKERCVFMQRDHTPHQTKGSARRKYKHARGKPRGNYTHEIGDDR